MLTPFHVAVQVRDIEEARAFYGEKLGFPEGRSADHWVDFDMFGHQFVVHLNPALGARGRVSHVFNPVEDDQVPVPHCGVVLPFPAWEALAARARAVIEGFVIEPHIRFRGQVGEQGTMFFLDPSGNALEFKAFRDIAAELFRKPAVDRHDP
ncbi:MAG TPA: VOC family protein [Gammaproteobacteria bacterium]|nr:VOC family protein [Gammaproteobacteria bacterium]